jgi:hypothetical protein
MIADPAGIKLAPLRGQNPHPQFIKGRTRSQILPDDTGIANIFRHLSILSMKYFHTSSKNCCLWSKQFPGQTPRTSRVPTGGNGSAVCLALDHHHLRCGQFAVNAGPNSPYTPHLCIPSHALQIANESDCPDRRPLLVCGPTAVGSGDVPQADHHQRRLALLYEFSRTPQGMLVRGGCRIYA